MDKLLNIPARNDLPEAQDYNSLRKKGLEYIQKLASTNWTDYNTHDPGITLLEVLCYGLTDLGYRVGFPMEDLLADLHGELPGDDNAMFSPARILTNKALTNSDYRKILIDIVGVKNAWLSKTEADGPGIYADCKKSILTFEESPHKVKLKGFYNAYLSMESDPELGDLNSDAVIVAAGGEFGDASVLEFSFDAFTHHKRKFPEQELEKGTFTGITRLRRNLFKAQMELKYDGVTLENQKTLIRLLKVPNETDITVAQLQAMLDGVEGERAFSMYDLKQKRIAEITGQAVKKLHANRNLCEDFIKVSRIHSEGIGICADVQATPNADLDRIQAEIYLKIINYLDPGIRFYSLQNLLGKGMDPGEIFNGPLLVNGFILNNELKAAQLRQTIYASDLIAEIMQIPGVISVSGLVMTSYDQWHNPVKSGEKWCLDITPDHQPVLSIPRSKFLFLKEGVPFTTRQGEVEDTLDVLLEMDRMERIPQGLKDFPAPKGRFRDPARYFSIQNDLPKAYGTGPEGPFEPLTPERTAATRQLKAFMFLSDQVLANYFSQVAHIREFFSLGHGVKNTMFSQFPETVAGAGELFEDVDEFKSMLPSLTEDKPSFMEKRNKILDHLLARFSENFTDYVLLMYRTGLQFADQEKVIHDKINFLQNYPEVSSGKHHGINYRFDFPGWPGAPPAGIVKRIGLLFGAPDISERSLLGLYPAVVANDDSTYSFFFYDDPAHSTILLKSTTVYPTSDEAREKMLTAVNLLYFIASYRVDETNPGEFVPGLYEGDEKLAEWDQVFENTKDAVDFLNDRLEDLRTDSEGIHLVENILLRPHDDAYNLFKVCLPENCSFCGEEDPYSFRATLVLPFWPDRFSDMNFRNFTSKTIRREIPAHLLPRICWVSPVQMFEFEEAWQKWRQVHAEENANQDAIRQANNNLILVIEKLRSVYPEATLHDCIDDSQSNPVMLNHTQLGTFKADEDETDQ